MAIARDIVYTAGQYSLVHHRLSWHLDQQKDGHIRVAPPAGGDCHRDFRIGCKVDYQTFNAGGQFVTMFVGPATVCLAVPLYKNVQKLKESDSDSGSDNRWFNNIYCPGSFNGESSRPE